MKQFCVNWRSSVADISGIEVCICAKLSPLGQQLIMLLLTRRCWRTTHTITAGTDATHHFTLYTANIDVQAFAPLPWHTQTHISQAKLSW